MILAAPTSAGPDRLTAAIAAAAARLPAPAVAPAAATSGPFALAAGPGATLARDGDVVCAVEGRVTNLGALADALGVAAGDPAAVVAAGWRRWGADVVGRFEGPFAVVIVAGDRGLAARDALGHRSLYVHPSGALATEVTPLLALLDAPPAPDPVAVAHFLARRPLAGDRTLLEHVRRVPPGHLVALGLDGWSAPRRWWTPRRPDRLIADRDEATVHLRAAMDAAVARARGADAEPAVLLSGGLDSGSVAQLARAQGATPATYSAVFPDHPEIDEAPAIAAHALDGHVEPVRGGSALDAAAEFVRAHALPPASANAFVWRPIVRRAVADGHVRVLDGEGGDELLGCSPWLLADALRAGRPDRAVALARRLPGMGMRPRPRWIARALRKYALRGALPAPVHRALRRLRHRDTPPPWLRVPLAEPDPWAWKAQRGPRWRAGLLGAVVDGSEAMGAHEQLRREARLCGATFVHPFRDPALLDAVLQIDPALMFDPVHDRPLARRAMRGLVPGAVLDADRKPHFDRLLAEALAGPDRAQAEALLADGAHVGAYVDLPAVRALLAATPDTSPRATAQLFRVLALELWLRERITSRGPSAARPPAPAPAHGRC